MKAFIGEPADENGNVLPCVRCDRRGSTWVKEEHGLEPRCSWHISDVLPLSVKYAVEDRKRDRSREEADRG